MKIASIETHERLEAMRKAERRQFQRVQVSLLGRFMLENRTEYPCQVTDMSPGGASLVTPIIGNIGERVIAYIDHIGRIEGNITRYTEGGFAMSVDATPRKREKLADQLTWLANRYILNLPEDRRHERVIPDNPITDLTLDDGRSYRCQAIDVSLSGAAVVIGVKPAIGTPVTLGKMRARVVRHLEKGIAVEFASVQSEDSIRKNM
ncbi:hypothetical protein GGD81_000716 [Rhodobium orientis]|uniref:Pilus assembly protein PilZ n=1 Tax=Rhodobium orientis TaxID=34017 RepID=A0A327JNY4_9HYPH|nr:PilZ domain-containing protein [Rhodobium orientis]MBB4301699.1 hypothetical protein [Rhodobium orientis]MBK5952393.1 pilus assembly protein PilZ [Rhodobium orientis]RAI28149.1 pilus assembly protein PilZ [Rhodobium orientis]